jgi:glycosyltransferase involved in cell wall biosynthesis
MREDDVMDSSVGLGAAPAVPPALDYDVVIPTHGRNLGLLFEAIASVLRQTLPPARVIVVVDGSPDAASELRQAHPDVTVLLQPHPRGQAAARQAGIQAATAEWVAFLDDDDLWSPRKQERCAEYLAVHPECGALRAGYWMFSSEGLAPGLFGQAAELVGTTLDELETRARDATPRNDFSYLEIEGRSLELMLEFNRGVIGTTMVRREILLAIPAVSEGTRPGDDFLLFCHVAAVTEWHLVRQRLEYYRLHPGQDTRRRGEAVSSARGIIRARREAWQHYGTRVGRPLAAYGRIHSDEVRQAVWDQVKRRNPAEGLRVYREALPLLPRLRHRVAAALPEPVVWRVRHLTGRHHATTAPAW